MNKPKFRKFIAAVWIIGMILQALSEQACGRLSSFRALLFVVLGSFVFAIIWPEKVKKGEKDKHD